jgi:hypothetical protein
MSISDRLRLASRQNPQQSIGPRTSLGEDRVEKAIDLVDQVDFEAKSSESVGLFFLGGFEFVRQAKPGGSCQLRGTDHGNCSFAMKLAGGVTGDRAVEARRCDDVSRNAKA